MENITKIRVELADTNEHLFESKLQQVNHIYGTLGYHESGTYAEFLTDEGFRTKFTNIIGWKRTRETIELENLVGDEFIEIWSFLLM